MKPSQLLKILFLINKKYRWLYFEISMIYINLFFKIIRIVYLLKQVIRRDFGKKNSSKNMTFYREILKE